MSKLSSKVSVHNQKVAGQAVQSVGDGHSEAFFEKSQIVDSILACHDVSTTYEIELAIAVFTSTFRVRCSVDLHSLIDANSNAGNRAAA